MGDTAENGLPDPAEMMGRLFPRRRARLVVEVDLDPAPGWGHPMSADDEQTHREVAESMTGLWQAERERADRLEAMCDRLAERLVVLPDLWREEGRSVMFNRAGDDLTPQARVGKWLHEQTRVIPPEVGEPDA